MRRMRSQWLRDKKEGYETPEGGDGWFKKIKKKAE